jgi:hypothetical protein
MVSLCLYDSTFSSQQFLTWKKGPLYLYTTQWSLLIDSIHETRDHSICLYITIVSSYQLVVPGLMYETGEKRPWCCIDREWSMVSCMKLVRRDLSVYNTMVSSHQFHTWDHRPLWICIMVFSHQFHAWDQGPLYLYTTTWSLHANSIHEIIDYSMYIMVSRVVYGLMYGIGMKRPCCCIDR